MSPRRTTWVSRAPRFLAVAATSDSNSRKASGLTFRATRSSVRWRSLITTSMQTALPSYEVVPNRPARRPGVGRGTSHHTGMNKYLVRAGQKIDLDHFDPDDTSLIPGGKSEAKERLTGIVDRLAEIQEVLFAGHQQKLLIVLQGMDTSGKDGAIRRVMRGFNPQGTRVVSFRKPSEEELDHDFLWRVHTKVPAKGEVVI